jgi:hypothetical protein
MLEDTANDEILSREVNRMVAAGGRDSTERYTQAPNTSVDASLDFTDVVMPLSEVSGERQMAPALANIYYSGLLIGGNQLDPVLSDYNAFQEGKIPSAFDMRQYDLKFTREVSFVYYGLVKDHPQVLPPLDKAETDAAYQARISLLLRDEIEKLNIARTVENSLGQVLESLQNPSEPISKIFLEQFPQIDKDLKRIQSTDGEFNKLKTAVAGFAVSDEFQDIIRYIQTEQLESSVGKNSDLDFEIGDTFKMQVALLQFLLIRYGSASDDVGKLSFENFLNEINQSRIISKYEKEYQEYFVLPHKNNEDGVTITDVNKWLYSDLLVPDAFVDNRLQSSASPDDRAAEVGTENYQRSSHCF